MTRLHRGTRLARLAGVVALVGASAALALPTRASAHTGTPTPALSSAASTSVSKTKVVDRVVFDSAGNPTTLDQHTVKLTVSRTTDLRSLQLIHVSWSGAAPTGGIVGDQNSDLAQNEEHSFVLLQCRGVDDSAAPAAQQLSPDTCWTGFADERFQYGYGTYPAWQSDGYATPDQRAAVVNPPSPVPPECVSTLIGTAFQRWIPFNGADGTAYPGGPFSCAGSAPEASPANLSNLALPSNETFGVTSLDGTGSTNFDVFTAEDHASLGCSQAVACTLVAIPIEGISCDSTGSQLPLASRPTGDDLAAATANCEIDHTFPPGSPLPSQSSGAAAVDGALWWSPSNWRNRITVPLTFGTPDNACGLANQAAPLNVYGSELMIQATLQWAPHFCLNSKLFNFNHVQTPEPLARNLLNTGAIEAAFSSRAPDGGFTTPTVSSPVAVTGFGIAFAADDGNQQPVPSLRLNARLLAKLLTESYPDQPFVSTAYKALAKNPLNITFDPEFQALNPGIPPKVNDAAATLLIMNTSSDVLEAMTSYINADPEARAWLDGRADPWGMVVNPNYKKVALPVDTWPQLDSFEPKDVYQRGKIDCLAENPVPWLPLVAAPTARLFSIGQDMQFAIAQSQTVCVLPDPNGSLNGAKMVAQGRQLTGHRFMLGIVSLGDAAREGLSLAALQTHNSGSTTAKFTSPAGRSFVAPSVASMRAAGALLKHDAATGLWPIPYQVMHTTSAGALAYPGTMVVYASVPTRGLPKADAKDLSELIAFAAGPGQTPGSAPGQLPDGYLPMTTANGLASLASSATHDAHLVAAQGAVTTPSSHPSTPPPSSPGSGVGATSAGTGGGNASGATTPTGKTHSPHPIPGKTGTLTAAPTSSLPAAAPVALTQSINTGSAGMVLPALAILIAAGLVGVAVVRMRSGTRLR